GRGEDTEAARRAAAGDAGAQRRADPARFGVPALGRDVPTGAAFGSARPLAAEDLALLLLRRDGQLLPPLALRARLAIGGDLRDHVPRTILPTRSVGLLGAGLGLDQGGVLGARLFLDGAVLLGVVARL